MNDRVINSNPFVKSAIVLLSKRFKQYFMHLIFVLSLFLGLIYCNFATSKYFTVNYIVRDIVKLDMMWRFTKKQCQHIAEDITTNSSLNLLCQ